MEERLLKEVQKSNPWWFGRSKKTYPYKRAAYPELLNYIETKQILGLVGLRRVGKTVLLKQLIEHLTSSVHSKDILFFSFEEKWGKGENLEDIIYYFLENVATGEQKYVFLDEIQKVEGWEDIIKRFYDREEKIKFIVCGSASLKISRSVESLAGRIFDFCIPPLSFKEFLEMKKVAVTIARLEFNLLELDFDALKKIYEANIHKQDRVLILFREFLLKGGFPEIIGETDNEIVHRYIKNSVVERILTKDIPEEFEVRRIDALRGILEYASRQTSDLYTLSNIASFLGINEETASNYVEYLKKSFLLETAYNHTKSVVKQLRTSKKMYIALPSIAMAMEGHGEEAFGYPEVIGKYIETLVAVFLKYEYGNVSFWRTPQKQEVDVVLKTKEGLIPIEVKYQSQITKADTKHLLKFCQKFNVETGIIITKNLFKQEKIDGKSISFIPAWFFLLLI